MKYTLVFGTLAGLLLAGCNKQEPAKAAPAQPPKQEARAADSQAAPIATPDAFKAGIGKAYAGYLGVAGALAHDDFAASKSASDSVIAALRALPKAGLDPAAASRWDSSQARLMGVLQPMAEAKDIAAMRDRLADLTPLMVEAMETFGAAGPDQAFLFHCPMARNSQGADWIQKGKQVENPYFGKQMPDCGSYVKDVKP